MLATEHETACGPLALSGTRLNRSQVVVVRYRCIVVIFVTSLRPQDADDDDDDDDNQEQQTEANNEADDQSEVAVI